MPLNPHHPLLTPRRMSGDFRCGIVLNDSEDVTIRAFGEIDVLSAEQLNQRLREAHMTNPERVTLDLRGVSFIDSYGVKALCEEAAAAAIRRSQLEIVASDCVSRLFRFAEANSRVRYITRAALAGTLSSGGPRNPVIVLGTSPRSDSRDAISGSGRRPIGH